MIRTAAILWGATFHTMMIVCALYAYIEGIHPYLQRKLGPAPFAGIPAFHPAREYLDDVRTALSDLD